jgi:uncharacterized protein (TIRG00374 family)
MKIQGKKLALILEVMVILLIFAYTLYNFDVQSFLEALSSIDAIDLVPIILFEVTYYVAHAAAFWLLCRRRFGLSFWEALGGSMLAWLVDILLPGAFVEGDVTRAVFLRTKGDWPRSVSYTIFYRFLINVTMVIFIVFTSMLVLNLLKFYQQYLALYMGVVAATLMASALLVLFLVEPQIVKSVAIGLAKRLKVKAMDKFERDLDVFLEYVAETSRDFKLGNAYLWGSITFLMIQWISGIMTPYFSLRAVGVEVNPLLIAPGYTILTVYSLASVGVPFMVGSIDAALVTLYILLGVPKEKALAATLVGRSITILVSTSLIYPIGIHFAREIFNSKNLSSIKESINKAMKEYGFTYTLFS